MAADAETGEYIEEQAEGMVLQEDGSMVDEITGDVVAYQTPQGIKVGNCTGCRVPCTHTDSF